MILTYALSPTRIIDYIDRPLIEAALARAFDRYSQVIPVFFLKTADFLDADVKVGFSSEDEDERYKTLAEDGSRRTLAYASWRKDGRVHLNTSVRWSVDFKKEKSRGAMDLETVLVHEIGHLLGLKHSSSKESVMYKYQSHRKTDVELKEEDVKKVRAKFVNFNNIHKRDWKILTVAGHFNPADNQCAGGGFILWDGARKLIEAQSFPLGCGSTASARFEACCHGLNFLKLHNLEKVMVIMDCSITGQGVYTRDASKLREWLLRALRFTGDGLKVGEWLIHQATDIKLQNRYREGLVATAELAKKGSRFELVCRKEEELPESVVALLNCEGRMLLHLHLEDFPI